MALLDEAALYTQLSEDHLSQAAQCLNKFKQEIKCTPGEAVLDVGCGPGNVTCKVILPNLHPTFSVLVGIDISSKMVDFARELWCERKNRLEFRVLDIAEPDSVKLHRGLPTTKFNKIFSFFALQWVSDRRQVGRNLNLLLEPGGEALLVLVVKSGVYPVWDALATSTRWNQYLKDVKVPLNEYQYMDNPGEEFRRCLEEAGLKVTLCQTQFHDNAFSSHTVTDVDKIAKLRSVDPLVRLIPDNLKDQYMKDVLEHTKILVGPRGAVDYTSLTVICHNPL